MNKVFSMLFIACLINITAKAQCDKKTVYTSLKQEWLNSKDEVQKNDEDKVTIEISKTYVTLNHNDDPNDEMKGDIESTVCNWTEAYKNGKSTIQAKLTEGHNDIHDATLTIEGKDGNVFILIELNDHPGMKIKAYIDKYTEEG